jgi:hypothetical protein
MECYTYAYLREDGTPYYIGKGTGKRKTSPHERRNGKFVPVPSDPDRILTLKHFETEEDAHRHEEYMISVFGREIDGGILINLCLGGKSRAFYKTDEERRLVINKRANDNYHNTPGRREYQHQKQKEYRQDPEKLERMRGNGRRRYQENREEYLKKKYKWREENKERLVEQRRKRYDPEKRRQQYLRKKNETN